MPPLTLDTPLLGWRPRDLERAYLPFLHGVGTANYFSDPAFRAGLAKPVHEDPNAAVLHFAVNVVTTGVPVRAAGLEELGVAPAPLARAVLSAWREELGSVRSKRCRVRGAP